MIRSVFLAVLMACASLGLAQVQPFTFIHFTDSHIGSVGHEETLKAALADVDKNFPEAELILLTGDVTEFGYTDEFEALLPILESSKRPIYCTSGNHDVRWSESGKENYRNALGDTYVKVDHKGVRFILLDTSMLIEHYGHFDGMQMKQLEADLQGMPEGGMAVLGLHHPPLSPGHFIDNEFSFADLISNYNVPLVCDGHGHTLARYTRNGTTYAMGASVSSKGSPNQTYRVYRVEPDGIQALVRNYKDDTTKTEDPVPVNSLARNTVKAERLEPGKYSVTLADKPYTGSAGIVLDQQESYGLSVADGILEVAEDELNNGIHQLTVQVPDSGTTVISTLNFETANDPRTSITRRFQLDSGNQSHPTVHENVLYVGANDGFLRAIDLADPEGKELWKTNLNREILSSPAVTDKAVIVGSMDTHVYALDRTTGEEIWKHKTGQAVLASPLIVEDTVFIGSGDYNMYALDLETGEKKWSFAAKKLIKCTPAYADGRLFFGAWDNRFYAVDAKTGELIWEIPVSQMANGHFSAATSNPVISGQNIIFCSHDYTVRCISQATGGTIWAYRPAKDELGPSYSTAVIDGDVAYFGSISGRVVGHHVDNGHKVFDVNVRPSKKDDLFDSVPRLKDGRIYIGSVGGNVYCVNIADKAVEWSVALQPGFIFTGPALWENKVLVGSLNDMVYEITVTE